MNWSSKNAAEITGLPLRSVRDWYDRKLFKPEAPADGWHRYDLGDLLRLMVTKQLMDDGHGTSHALRIGGSTKIRDVFREDYDAERNELTRQFYLQVAASGGHEKGGSIYQFNLVEPVGGKVSMVDDITLEPLERVILINLNAAFDDLKQRLEAYKG